MPESPDGVRVEQKRDRGGAERIKITWLEERGLGDWFGETRGRGSLALVVFGISAIAYLFYEVLSRYFTEGNRSALYLAVLLCVVVFLLVYVFLSESYNQRVVFIGPQTIRAVWRPFPGFNSWKKPASSVARLYFNDYCLYAEFSDGRRRFLLPRDMTGERQAFVKARIEETLGISPIAEPLDATESFDSVEELQAVAKGDDRSTDATLDCPVCGTAFQEREECSICGADKYTSIPRRVEIIRRESESGDVALEITVSKNWEFVGFGLLPTVFTLTLPGSMLLAGGIATLPFALLFFLPAVFLFYYHLLEQNRTIIRVDSQSLSVRYEPIPRPGWTQEASQLEGFAEFSRLSFRPRFLRNEPPQPVTLVALSRGLRWSPQVLHTYDKHVFSFVRRTLSTRLENEL